jgi:hypothetical protein
LAPSGEACGGACASFACKRCFTLLPPSLERRRLGNFRTMWWLTSVTSGGAAGARRVEDDERKSSHRYKLSSLLSTRSTASSYVSNDALGWAPAAAAADAVAVAGRLLDWLPPRALLLVVECNESLRVTPPADGFRATAAVCGRCRSTGCSNCSCIICGSAGCFCGFGGRWCWCWCWF